MDNTKTMEQTVQLIEQGLVDIKNNKATKAEVLELIDERVKGDAEAAAMSEKVAALQGELDTQKQAADELRKGMRRIRSNGYAAIKDSGGRYRGLFGSPVEAKLFGLTIMAACTAGIGSLSAKHKAALEALDEVGGDKTLTWLNEKGVKDMTGSSQTGGSALVSPDFIPTMISNFEQHGVFERNAQVVPLGSSGGLQPVDNGESDDMGGIYVPGEGKTITKSDPDIGMISHQLRTLCKLMAYSLELDEDSALELGEMLGRIIFRCYGKAIDRIGFLGDGTSDFFGMTGIVGKLLAVDSDVNNIKSIILGTGAGFSGLTLGDFEKVVGMPPDYADDGAKWFMHRYVYWTVFVKLALAMGGAHAQEAILGAGYRQKQALSYPVEFTQVMPKATANDMIAVIFGDLDAGAQMGRRGALEIAQSTERYFDQGLVAVRARRRISVNVHDVGNTDRPGPILGLRTGSG